MIQKTGKKLNFAGFSFLNSFESNNHWSSFFSFFKIMQRIKDLGGVFDKTLFDYPSSFSF
jgi:hypothetical protein